jgi:rod shape determining protein RodA
MKRWQVLQRLPGVPLLAALALAFCGLLFIGSATRDDVLFAGQQSRQALFLLCGAGFGGVVLLVPYIHILRLSWLIYGGVVLMLLGLPFFAPELNGARRWYALPGFSIQPSEFAKLAVVLALANLLRFKSRARTFEGLVVPMAIAGLPALLVLLQPDLGSALVFAPVLLAMCYAAGTRRRDILLVLGIGLVVAAVGYFFLHDYQRERVETWWQHWWWPENAETNPEVRTALRRAAYQPWQALVALGAGGWLGFGIGEGPQNRYDFLPYRSEDYVFAVVGEETGFVGCVTMLALVLLLVLGLLQIAMQTRERYGRLVCVGVATWIASQSLMHVAVCAWLLPSTGLPMPLVSYGGSSALAVMLAVAVCLNIGAQREPILAADGFV